MTDKNEKKAKPKPKARPDTTEPHPLFGGNPEQFNRDREWRKGVPKAGSGR